MSPSGFFKRVEINHGSLLQPVLVEARTLWLLGWVFLVRTSSENGRCVFPGSDSPPDLKIKNRANEALVQSDKSHDFYYNFFDFAFENGYSWGEDVSFCKLARKEGCKLYANIESPTAHRGEYSWVGKFGDSLKDIK